MEIFDSHVHLAHPELFPRQTKIIKKAKIAGISRMLTVGYDESTSLRSIEIARKNDGIWAAVGIHPNEKFTKRIADTLPITREVKAIGETGLDYYRKQNSPDVQKQRFYEHITLAQKYNLPLVIHNRNSIDDIISILQEKGYHRGVFHCFGGNAAQLKKILNLGLYVSFAGNLTFRSSKLSSLLKFVPNDRMLFETDSPYLSPKRGERNEPANIVQIISHAAESLNISCEKLARVSTENGCSLFGV